MGAEDILTFIKREEELEFDDKDGGSDGYLLIAINIRVVENGYILEISSDEDYWEEIFAEKPELIERLSELT